MKLVMKGRWRLIIGGTDNMAMVVIDDIEFCLTLKGHECNVVKQYRNEKTAYTKNLNGFSSKERCTYQKAARFKWIKKM